MGWRYTPAQEKQILSSLEIIADTREQVNEHVLRYFEEKKVKTVNRALGVGDYSAQVLGGRWTAENHIVIERKGSLDELAGNITTGRQRLESEFMRAFSRKIKVHLLIEGATWSDIYTHNYRSKLDPKSFIGTLLSWWDKYNLSITFCKPSESGRIIYGILYYHVRNAIQSGEYFGEIGGKQ